MFYKLRVVGIIFISLFSTLALAAAPDITVKDVNGKSHNVNQHIGKGKWTVVVFWAYNCHVCNAEIQQMTFFQDDHAEKDATVLGISVDGFDKVKKSRAFIDNHELNFPNYLIKLEESEFLKFGGGRFGGTPTFYLYNPAGELVAKNLGAVSPEVIEKFIKDNS
ncbi:MAG: TlpA family protein disulfide reductase [Gammaproteobacteria bacterium]|nr:TlpA family protein disulfide reductase [Gammaproteobacteria bacterium]